MDAEEIARRKAYKADICAQIAQYKKDIENERREAIARKTRQKWLYTFAGQALMGLCANPNGFDTRDEAVKASICLAHELLKELEKQ